MGPNCPLSLLFIYSSPSLPSFPFPFLTPSAALLELPPIHSLSFPMFFSAEEDVQFCRPVLESEFTPTEIQELWSLFGDPAGSNSGSQGSCREVSLIDDERRHKRMKSNRESARRSRLRKKKHLENLTIQTNRLKVKNQELQSQLSVVLHRHYMVRKQNDRLWSEYVALHARLFDLYRIAAEPMQRVAEKANSCMQMPRSYYS